MSTTTLWFTRHPLRLLGDMVHLASFLILLLKIKSRHSCAGISLKTQEIYAIIFVARYLDLFTNHRSYYLTVMKIIFIASTSYVIYLMRVTYKKTYSKDEDTFPRPLLFLVAPCAALSILLTARYEITEILWTFSILLEAIAILPQLWMLLKHGETVEVCASKSLLQLLTAHYIASLGAYRALYLLNWIVRAITEDDYSQWLVWIFGLVQNCLYVDFFIRYLKSMWYKQRMTLPTTK